MKRSKAEREKDARGEGERWLHNRRTAETHSIRVSPTTYPPFGVEQGGREARKQSKRYREIEVGGWK
jgi:hypothetical protein